MRKICLLMVLFTLAPVMLTAAQTPLEKPAVVSPALQNPAVEKIGRQLRPWLAMEINDFRTLWNGRPMYSFTLTNHSREQSDQLEVTTSFADGPNGPWRNADVLGFMSLPAGASQGPVTQTFPRGTRWINVEIRQDLKPGKPVVLAKKFQARYAGPAISSVTRKVVKDKTVSKSGPQLAVTIENPTVETFRDDCFIQWSFSDSPKGMQPVILHKESLVIPAAATITHDLPMTKDASKPYLTVAIKGLYDTVAIKRFKQVGRTFKPIK